MDSYRAVLKKITPNVQVEHNAGISIRIGRITKVFALVGFIDLVDEQCAISWDDFSIMCPNDLLIWSMFNEITTNPVQTRWILLQELDNRWHENQSKNQFPKSL